MNKRALRQKELLHILSTQGMLPIKTLSEKLNVSEMTIRRDLNELKDQPVQTSLILPNCNISSERLINSEYNLLDELKKADDQKERIGAFSASLIQENDVVIIDTGTTTSRILPYIPNEYNLTVLCYSTNILFHLLNKANTNVLFCGGVYHKNAEMFESPEGLKFIERTRANKVFLSAAGIHKDLGITCANNYEIATKNAVINSSVEKILMADSNKFGQVRSSLFCTLSDISTIVTDNNLSEEWQEYILSLGIKLHLV